MKAKKLKFEVAGVIAAMALSSGTVFAEGVEITGVAEVEANFTQDTGFAPGVSESDIALATVELGVDAAVSKDVSAHVLFLYEEDDTVFDVDEGNITVKLNETTSLTAGKMYVPFGNFESNMISDPLTLELGETNETVIQLGFESGAVTGSVYVFNGDSGKVGSDESVDGMGANVDMSGEFAGGELNLGASYISNIADSNALQEVGGNAEVADTVPGYAFIANWSGGPLSVTGEYVAATTDFSAGDLGAIITAATTPTAMNIEFGYDLANGMTVAAAYQASSDARFLGLAEDGYLLSLSTEVAEGAALAVEYSMMNDYSVADGGTGESSSNLALQMAVEF